MDTRDRKKSYSDLEAIVVPSTGHMSYLNEKFLAPNSPEPVFKDEKEAVVRSSSPIDSVHSADTYNTSLSPVDTISPPPPAYYLVDSKGQKQALYTVPTNTTASDVESIVNFKGGYDAATPPGPGGWWKSMGQGRRILGMRKNVFLSVCAGLCFLILGILLTVLAVTKVAFTKGGGGSSSSSNNNKSSASFTALALLNKPDVSSVLMGSNLASMNWTDTSTGDAYTGVFYQSSRATGMSLMVAIQNEASNDWTTVNISASASDLDLNVLPGTPLAAASNNGLWNLFYVDQEFGLHELYSTDPTSPTGWLQGEFSSKLNGPTVVAGSGLGAMWQSCDDCDNALFVTWQDGPTGNIVYANETNLTWGEPVVISSTGTTGSSLAVSAFTDYEGTGPSGTDHNAVRMYYETPGGLFEMMKGPLGGGELTLGNFGKPVSKDLPMDPSPAMASLTYGNATTGWSNNLLAYINPWKGILQTANWQGAGWVLDTPSLNGAPNGLQSAGFSAIALTQEMKIFLMSPSTGAIHSFTTTGDNPSNWTWQGSLDV